MSSHGWLSCGNRRVILSFLVELTPKIREVSKSVTKFRPPPPKKKKTISRTASQQYHGKWLLGFFSFWDFSSLPWDSIFVVRNNKKHPLKAPHCSQARGRGCHRYDTARDGFSGSDPHRESVWQNGKDARMCLNDIRYDLTNLSDIVFEWHIGMYFI